jgi:DNA-binding protein HU-beta
VKSIQCTQIRDHDHGQKSMIVANASIECLHLSQIAVLINTPLRFRGGTTMTKAELIEEVAKQAECTKADAERTLTAFFDLVVASTKKGEKVAWPGFGSFSTTARKARTGRNPQTGAAVTVPASTAMKFTASSTLKAQLNPNRK